MNKIYALHDPISGDIRYVGKTKNGLHQRLLSHLSDATTRPRVRRFVWINELRARGLCPTISLLEEGGENWQQAESKWIESLRERGCNLLNIMSGGDGPETYHPSESVRQSLSIKAKERYKDPAYRKKMGDAVRAGYSRQAARDNLSAALKVTFARPEVKARLSAAQKISCNRQEVKDKRSKALRGRVITAEHRKKLSLAQTGKKLSAEHVARLVASHCGLKRSEETKAKMRAAITPQHKAASAARCRERYASMTAEQLATVSKAASDRMTRMWAQRRAAAHQTNLLLL